MQTSIKIQVQVDKSGKVASNAKTFEVYLNITKLIDIKDPEAND